ncbi:MAG: hypothetical protein IT494_08840 [Gammaproteobacteria bacterium]|nr:hypothetical protein [Gammaproteobacteria bacterium]
MAAALATLPARAANDAPVATTMRIGEAAPTLHAEEYRVLSAVLRHGLPADTRRLVIEAATVCDHETLTRLEQDPAAVGKLELTPELVTDFAVMNATPVVIERRFDIAADYTLLDRRELDTLFAKDGWPGFFSKYIATPGVLRLSRVGFDPAIRHALVMVEQLCGSECGAGRLVRLERGDDESWRVLDATIVWLATRADTTARNEP